MRFESRAWTMRSGSAATFALVASLLLAGPFSISAAEHPHSPATPPAPASDERAPEQLLVPVEPGGGAQLIHGSGEPSPPPEEPSAAGPEIGRNRLVLPSGLTFHRTNNEVIGLETIPVPGTSIQIYVWDEKPKTGELRSFYAFSHTGTALRGRVRSTDNLVRLSAHRFEPLKESPGLELGSLAARKSNRLFLVQLVAAPLPEMRETITALGATILRYLSDHTYIVEMESLARSQIEQLPYIRWIGPYHPAYRLEGVLLETLLEGGELPPQRFSIMLGQRSRERQLALSEQIEGAGGAVDMIEPGGMRVEATLDAAQLAMIVHSNDVQFIDRWGGPGETDMDIVRQLGGADFLESTHGWTGQGVRGEIFDTELRTTHSEWPTAPILHSAGSSCASYHGTACYSINFAQGIDPAARGLIPDGQGIFFCYGESTQFGGSTSRYDANQELIDPFGPYRAVFQTSSVGSTRTTEYTTISAEVDDYLFLYPLLSTQSQSNAGSQYSRPQAWAKNIVAVGGIRHLNTADRCDDYWGRGASIGPAADGRVKPDLAYFYDSIHSAWASGDSAYYQFGGTSAATPETAGHFGLLHQMWHEGVWAGHGGGADPFESRPQMSTAKALMINSAFRYDWNNPGGCSYSDVNRWVQGWGTADLEHAYERAPKTIVIDETDLLQPLATNSYTVQVAAGETELAVTMAYTDPAGTVGAAEARVNDLSLRVTSPAGTVYWGNNGLINGNLSVAGGSSDTVNTVENVFIQGPAAGAWTVEVLGDEIVQDAHTETPEIDADYALVINGGTIESSPFIPLSSFSHTFTAAALTRGFFFTAPTDLVITGLQVPDESGHGLQNVEVIRFEPGVIPPTYSATTEQFTSLFRSVGTSSGQVIAASIPVYAGDVIGILGACGDSTTMRSSYGPAPHASSILGQPTTLSRLGMQYNLATTPARGVFTSTIAYIGRVKVFYTAMNEAPMPSFSRTFSDATRTRGYWFTAPRDFTIVGLQVPDEAAQGLQNVAVVRFDSGVTPPAWSSTTDSFTTLLLATAAPSDEIVKASIPVSAGDVIGVLGGAGDAAMMHSSYGATYPFTSEIFGSPVTFQRLGMQHNLASTAPTQLWTESYNIARVRLLYAE